MTTNLTPAKHTIAAVQRRTHYGHDGGVIWLTGLSAAGKTTLAMALEKRLFELGYSCYVLDGDNIRTGLNSNLGFSPADRTENIRRVGEVAALFADAGLICITAFISPYRADREAARKAIPHAFHEVYLAADVETCAARDPKGFYRRARNGEIREFTGISAPYEVPTDCDLRIETGAQTMQDSLDALVQYVRKCLPMLSCSQN